MVDDHRMVRQSLRKILEDHKDFVVVDEAANGKEAIKLAREYSPDVILMDVNMPTMSGIEATRRITAEMSKIQIIGLSMNNKDSVIEDMKSAGASRYLQKTEAFGSLIKTIRSVTSSNDEESSSGD